MRNKLGQLHLRPILLLSVLILSATIAQEASVDDTKPGPQPYRTKKLPAYPFDEASAIKPPSGPTKKASALTEPGQVMDRSSQVKPVYFGSINGTAFCLIESGDKLESVPLKTSLPVFKAFGLSADEGKLLYTPLNKGIPSGEIFIEDINTAETRKISSHLVLEAAWSPIDPSIVAYTFSDARGFGLAIVNVTSGRTKVLVKDRVLADFLQWDKSGKSIYYFETADAAQHTTLSSRIVSIETAQSTDVLPDDRPDAYPILESPAVSPTISTASIQQNSGSCLFRVSSPNGSHEVLGDNFIGAGTISIRSLHSGAIKQVGTGQVLRVLAAGIVARSVTDTGTKIELIDWNGQSRDLGLSIGVKYNLPLKASTLVQAGAGYNSADTPPIFSHTFGSSMSFAYDLQGSPKDAHVMASSDGLVVFVGSDGAASGCPDHSGDCDSADGWGSVVIIQHPDGTYTKYAHLNPGSLRVGVNTRVSQGFYLANQGRTECDAVEKNGCGSYVHFQRQLSSALSGYSIPITLADVSSNPLSSQSSFGSGSTESDSFIPNVGQPNLTPFQPSGWSDRIVVSTVPGNHSDSPTLRPTDTLFIDWAVTNNGSMATTARYHTKLFVDGIERATWFTDPPHQVNFFTFVEDFSIGSLGVGTHTIRIFADALGEIGESNGADNEYTKFITITSPGLPNLTPFQPSGWSDKIVVSTVPGNHSDSPTLRPTDTLFVDWAVINNGTGAALSTYRTKLFVDGVERATWFTDPPHEANFFTFVEDFSIGSLGVGTHSLRIVTDFFGEVAESNGADNEYTKTITVTSPGLPNLTPFQPSGWSDKIVVSTVTGTHTDSGTLRPTDTLFIDWAVTNNGSTAATARYHTKLFVDGIERATWFTDPPHEVNFFTFVEDFSIGSLGVGTHTVRIFTDALGEVGESNGADNEYTRTITVSSIVPPPPPCFTLTTNASPIEGGTISQSLQSNCTGARSFSLEPEGLSQSLTPMSASMSAPGSSRTYANEKELAALISRAESSGPVQVIIRLRAPFQAEGYLSSAQAIGLQRNGIAQVQDDLLNRMAAFNLQSVKRFETIPFLAAEVDASGLRYLQSSPDVVNVGEDLMYAPMLRESVPLIGATAAWAAGFSGAGQTVAILDTGVDKTHPFLAGKVVSEACFSSNSSVSSSLCPGGLAESINPGSGINCILDGCDHGTHVAGIAAGKGPVFSGVAKDANIIAIQVFTRIISQAICGDETAPCLRTATSDQIKGLERVQSLANTFNIAAVNMSLGGGQFFSPCDSSSPANEAITMAITNLRSRSIATVISSGNEEFTNSMGSPGCISKAVSVGSTGDGGFNSPRDVVSAFSNSASFLNLLAPGQRIESSVPGGVTEVFNGTSMAAPHVAGAWAILKSKQPTATVDQILSALTSTGVPVLDTRNGIVKPRIQVDAALNALSSGGGSGGGQYSPGTTVTLTATPRPGFTFVKWQRNGVDFSTSATVNVTMSAASSMTAIFNAAPTLPTISAVFLSGKKSLRLDGANFGQFPRVLINNVDRSSFIKSSSQVSIQMTGKHKKMGLRTGRNTLQVIGIGNAASELFVLNL